MGTENTEMRLARKGIDKIDALAVGLAVLEAVLHVRRAEHYELLLVEQGVNLRVKAYPPIKVVVIDEVDDAGSL
jgi:hypothetical protein